MEEIWQKNFKNREVKFPNELATEYCNQLYDLTGNLVIAKVERYNKSISEMNAIAPIANLANATSLLIGKSAEHYLGEISGSSRFTYELYLTGVNTPKYKYRFCFIENGVYPYPVTVVLDSDIAKELKVETNLICENEAVYKEILRKVLNSNKMNEVIEGLMTINFSVN